MGPGLPGMIVVSAALLFAAVLSAVLFKRLKIPYTIGLVFVGIALHYLCGKVPQLEPFSNLKLSHDLIMYALLPSLIFSASINIDSKLLLKNFNPTFLLAGPGLVVSTLAVGFIMYYFTPLDMAGAMLFGALISATDPVAVISLFEMVGAPKRLRILVDGESLFNDATAIVMYTLVLKIVFSGAAFTALTAGWAAYQFLFIFFGGLIIGAIAGYLMVQIILLAHDDPRIEIALSVIVAYCAFIFADRILQVSGVMACLGAGLVVSYYGISRFSEKTRNYIQHFWEFIAFVANSYIFILLGFTEDFYLLNSHLNEAPLLNAIVWGIISIQVSRAVIIFGICTFIGMRDSTKKISFKYQLLMFWGGLRGAVPLALVFSLPADLPHRALIVQITLGVVIFTLFVQGISISGFLRLFKLDRASLFQRFSEGHALLLAREYGLDKLRNLKKAWHFPANVVGKLEDEYQDKIYAQHSELKQIVRSREEEDAALRRSIWMQGLRTEMLRIRELFDSGFINESIFRHLYFCMQQQIESVNLGDEYPPSLATEAFKKQPFTDFRLRLKYWRSARRYQAHVINAEYLSCCAIAIGVSAARERLVGLRNDDFFKDYPEGIHQCEEFFSKSFNRVQARFESLEKVHRKLFMAMSTATLQQMLYSNELARIDDLLANEEISEHIYNDLSAFFHKRIKANSTMVYRKLLEEK